MSLTSLRMFVASVTFILPTSAFFINSSAIQACNSPLGIQNGQIPDTHLSASSYSSYLYIGRGKHMDMQAKYCRLNHQFAWCTNKGNKEKSWLMVDLGRITNVTSISTQGFAGVSDYFVSSFKLAYSIDRNFWKFVRENGVDKVFRGNKHGLDIKNNKFSQIEARYIKIFPVSFYIRICLRIELYGCVQGIPSNQHSTRVPSSQSVSATSAHPSKGPSTVAMTMIQSSKGVPTTIATFINALHKKHFSEDEKKKDFIITGFSIFGGLVLLVILPILIFCIVKRRKRSFNVDCQLVDLPEYPYNIQVNSNESFIALENDSAVIQQV
ncbi:lactadherin-like isoform X5 [Actinia tenebrosa]|uniref:Lactadherin-like isoform X5 n=1 Tax=Actinia tenebrosa TaxID=6105 RepID=A0A6P8ICL7_ACTTE|nr:lactadherin-like isoform X5 [Actinia tenebrosa]